MRSIPKPEAAEAAVSIEPKKRRRRSKRERRLVVEETFVPGASVAVIARSHGVNANQVFHWRKLYREGLLDVQPSATQFLPAKIIDSSQVDERRTETQPYREYAGAIAIEVGDARVRITGSADPICIRAVLEQLRR